MTIAQLREILQLSTALVTCEPMILVPGQGMSDADMASILALVETSAQRHNLDFSLWHRWPRRAGRALSHKWKPANSLISEPRKIDEDRYLLDLLIDDACELMGDHQTGQHLQGMLLVEAVRQSFLAVTEAFFLPQDGTRYYFIFNNIAAEYKKFLFPLAAQLHYRVCDREVSASSRRFTVEVGVEQAAGEAVRVSGIFTVVKDRSLRKMEEALAKEALAGHYAQLAANRDGVGPAPPPEVAHAG